MEDSGYQIMDTNEPGISFLLRVPPLLVEYYCTIHPNQPNFTYSEVLKQLMRSIATSVGIEINRLWGKGSR